MSTENAGHSTPHNCPTCTCGMVATGARVQAKRKELEALCKSHGMRTTLDGYVFAGTAAKILGKSPSTLKNWRYLDMPLRGRSVAGQWQYSLDELAAFLIAGEEKYAMRSVTQCTDTARFALGKLAAHSYDAHKRGL